MNRESSRRSGFTLIELMVVVAIMGVILAAGILRFIKWCIARP